MQLLIDIRTKKDKKLFIDLANRLDIKSAEISVEDFEDIALAHAIKNGLKSPKIDKETFINSLQKRINKK
ncbi:MAG: hypothetical protein H7Y00_16775 [Fimbriimonadaceae bacterium]|nr:hypothetical protein [Chitinophagales bacterium]